MLINEKLVEKLVISLIYTLQGLTQ